MKLNNKKITALFTAILFSFMAVMPVSVKAQGIKVKKSNVQVTKNPGEKIDISVKNAFDNNEFVEVLITMNEKVNTMEVAQRAKIKNSVIKTPNQMKIARRYAVFDALNTTAKKSQKNLMKYLDKQRELGNVQDFKSFFIVNMAYVKATKEVVEEISKMTEVRSIIIDKEFKVDWPEINKDDNVQISSGDPNVTWSVKNIQADRVWDELNIYGDGVVVGIIDTGFDYNHEAIKRKWRGYNPDDPSNPIIEGNWADFATNSPTPTEDSTSPHGTHVAGTIVGADPEGLHQIGVAPNAQFITAKALTSVSGKSSWMISAGQWMLAPDGKPELAPDVVNNSWGAGPGTGDSEFYRDIMQAWRAAGILPVFAAGNEEGANIAQPGSVAAPAAAPEAFAVGAVDENFERPIFSLLGPGPNPDDLKPDIAAPGVAVESSVLGGGYQRWDGTSMAAPHIAGVAALLLSADASLTPDQLEDIMMQTATPLTDEEYPEAPNFGMGHGCVNAYAAVQGVAAGMSLITGKVLVDGEDSEKPEIIGYELLENLYEGFSAKASVTVSDDIAITNVELLIRPNGMDYWLSVPLSRKSGDHKLGTYSDKVDGGTIRIPGFDYKFKVTDYAGNVVESVIESATVKFGENPGEFTENFDTYPGRWIQLTGDWQWGIPTSGPVVEDGNNLVGTNLNGKYSNDSLSQLITPPLNLTREGFTAVSFKEWHKLADSGDKLQVLATNNFGEDWYEVYNVEYITNQMEQWNDVYVDLSEFTDSANPVFLNFILEANFLGNNEGWFIDDVELIGEDTEAPSAPINLIGANVAAGVELQWDAGIENDIKQYHIFRRTTEAAVNFEEIGISNSKDYVDTTTEGGVTYEYCVKVSDYAGNMSEASEAVQVLTLFVDEIYSTDFETDNGGFTSGGTASSWEYGVPTSGPENAASGSKLWATNLSGDYQSDEDSYIELKDIDLTGKENVSLTFNSYLHTEADYDFARVRVFKHGSIEWDEIWEKEGVHKQWENVSLTLEDYSDEIIDLRFVLESDFVGDRPGWYIDDVKMSSTTDSAISVQNFDNIDSETKAMYDELRANNANKEKTQKMKIDYKSEENIYSQSNAVVASTSGIPVKAVITVLETGRVARTNPVTGAYRLPHPMNEDGSNFTVVVESYGYKTLIDTVQLVEGEAVEKNFRLVEAARGSVEGTLIDAGTGEAIEGAVVRVIEDAHVDSVVTDENGKYIINDIIIGEYTLEFTHADYVKEINEVTITENEITNMNVEMYPFIGSPNEIVYDNGNDDNATVLNNPGYGVAVRFTPEGNNKILGARIKIYSDEWPSPGGNEIKVAIIDANTKETLYIKDVEVVRGEWNYIDLSEGNVYMSEDFYIGTIQTKIGDLSPGICTETNSFSGRSYLHGNGTFQAFEEADGNAMIRAVVETQLEAPVIQTPSNMQFTNSEDVTVEGAIQSDEAVNLYVNGELATTVQAEDNHFSGVVKVAEGLNEIYAQAVVGEKVTRESSTIKVIMDSVKPIISIDEPIDNAVINEEAVTIEGTVTEINLASFTINDELVDVNEDGTFTHKTLLNIGENTLNIIATDKAQNITEKIMKITVNKNLPTITEVTPSEDLVVKVGDEIKVSFKSNALGGKACFNIVVPNVTPMSNAGIEMTEISAGLYEGTWVVPEGTGLINAKISVEITDAAGNRNQTYAEGTITTEENFKVPVEIMNLEVKEQFGGTVVEAQIKNVSRTEQAPLLIIVVSDSMNRVVNMSTARISQLKSGNTITLGSGFSTPDSGNYTIRAFVWDNMESMNPLSEPVEKTFVVE